MAKLNLHTKYNNYAQENIPIIAKLNEVYKLWHTYLTHLPRITRYTLGEKIDNLFTDCLELALLSSYRPKHNKLETIEQLNAKFDTLKFFIKLLWEIKEIDTNKLTALSIPLSEIGRMIGGWMKLFKDNPTPRTLL
ncbi:four helix bundle protein [Patescibacteria group bacterium]|nr:four helix bundle protein [Patescibacteria group bacterium]MCG2687538.1 four helix bundle protein [Candidatus Parcubacteria bacterium]